MYYYLAAAVAAVLLTASNIWFFLRLRRRASQIETFRRQAQARHENAHQYLLGRLADLRRPLQGILGVRDVYEAQTASPEMKDFLEVVDHCVKYVVRQLERVQFFSEFETGKMVADWKPFALIDSVEKTCHEAEKSVFGGTGKIDLEIQPGVRPMVVSDRRLFEKLIYEFLANAVKHFASGPVKLTVAPGDGHVVHFTISDCGPGLGENELRAALNSADADDKQNWNEGAGLGFPIVRKITRYLNGRYEIATQPGRGTTVHLYLPLPPDEGATIHPTHEHAFSSRILVVEDDLVSRQLIRRVLEKLGYAVTTAENGQAAVDMFKLQRFGVIFMDLEMDGIDGLEATRRIFAASPDAKPKVIALTGHGLAEDKEKCLAAGMTEVLVKPASAKQIERILNQLGVKPLHTVEKIIEIERMFALHGESEAEMKAALKSGAAKLPSAQNEVNAAVMAEDSERITETLIILQDVFVAIHCDHGTYLCEQAKSLVAHWQAAEFLSVINGLNDICHTAAREIERILATEDFASLIV